jgi:cytochrome c biogenesis protein CcmG, thiol:disulfide interchange protein DsbE
MIRAMLESKHACCGLLVLSLFFWQAGATAKSLSTAQWETPLANKTLKTTLSHYKGEVIWLDFWASWCVPCRASFPWLNDIQQRYESRGLKVIAINLDENTSDAEDFLRQVPANFQVFYDPQGSAPTQFDIQGMPTSVIIDREGNVHLFHIGFNESDKAELEAILQKVLMNSSSRENLRTKM